MRTEADRAVARKASAKFRASCKNKGWKPLQIYVPGDIRAHCRAIVRQEIIAYEMKNPSS